ncbi:TPA: hypothetical protein N0F65_002237 [Lagenidium giganteum]|uniref:MATE efflux family protein n=1 Tax=Lagenidium giganteum TaxID=4803 RepID=A0AAV2YW34_9STRA|nr:TPA: hypothetical protein N0F65_002237 [Lagenidium giganteum]
MLRNRLSILIELGWDAIPSHSPSRLVGSSRSSKMPKLAHEFRALLRLAVPSMMSTYCFFGISVTELSVMGHLGVDQLAAVAYSQMSMDFSTLVFMQGFNAGTNSLCSQAFGAKNYRLLGEYAQMTLFAQTVMCVPLALLWWNLGDILALAGVADAVATYARTYCRLSIIWLWPRSMFQVLSIYYQSQQIVVPTACINVMTVGVNLVLATGLTYGKFGLPALGFIGCPIGTSVALFLRLAVYHGYMNVYKCYHHRTIPKWRWNFLNKDLFVRLASVGVPLALGNMFENAQLQTMALFSATIGKVQLGTHNSMMELFFFATSPIYGLINASVTRMGSHLGAGKMVPAIVVAKLAGICIGTLSVTNGLIMVFFKHDLGKIFSNDPLVVDNFAQIASLGGIAYCVLAFFYYSMAVLQAQARSTPVMVAFTAGAWLVGVPSAYFLGIAREPKDFFLIWVGMLCGYVVTASIGFYAAFFNTDWEEETHKAVERSRKKKSQQQEYDALLPK